MNYTSLMERAIEISMPFKYLVKPNPMVGALIVKGDQILICKVIPKIFL